MNKLQASVSNGLSTDLHKVSVAGAYYLSAQSTVQQGSAIVITLAQTGSVSSSVATPATSPVQEMVSIQHTFNCAVNDILSVVVTSAAAADQPPAMLKTTITLREGLN